MPELRHNPALRDIQSYIVELERERGFSHQDVLKKCLLLGEEGGELFKKKSTNAESGRWHYEF